MQNVRLAASDFTFGRNSASIMKIWGGILLNFCYTSLLIALKCTKVEQYTALDYSRSMKASTEVYPVQLQGYKSDSSL